MVRRSLAVGIALVLVIGIAILPGSAAAVQPVSILLNGESVHFEVPPIIKEDRTFVPVRFVLDRIGAEIKWDGVKRQVTILYGDRVVVLTLDSNIVVVDGVAQEIDVAPFILSNRTMVPLRFVAETFGFGVGYDAETATVSLVLPPALPAVNAVVTVAPPAQAGTPVWRKPEEAPTPPLQPPSGGVTAPTTPFPPVPSTGGNDSGTTTSPPTPPGAVMPAIKVVTPATAKVGDTFTVSVQFVGVHDIKSAGVILSFDKSRVQAQQVISGGTLEGLAITRSADNAKGTVSYMTATTDGTFSGDGTYFAVVFKALVSGQVQFSLSGASTHGALWSPVSQFVPATLIPGDTAFIN